MLVYVLEQLLAFVSCSKFDEWCLTDKTADDQSSRVIRRVIINPELTAVLTKVVQLIRIYQLKKKKNAGFVKELSKFCSFYPQD
jgi:hypothetical protein